MRTSLATPAPREWTKDPNTWLTTTDIKRVLAHYEREHPSFHVLGPSPIDFDTRKSSGKCVWPEICNLNTVQLERQGRKFIGMVFNLDPHDEPGSHWVALAVDLRSTPEVVYYFDSMGKPAPKRVKVLVKRIAKQREAAGHQCEFATNAPFVHQRGTTECGLYVIHVLTSMFAGKLNPEDLKTTRITDGEMFKQRRRMFRFDTE